MKSELLETINADQKRMLDSILLDVLKFQHLEISRIVRECNAGAYSALYAVERLTEVLGECNE